MSLAGLTTRLNRLAEVPRKGTRDAARAVERVAKAEGQRVGPVHMGRRKRAVRLTAVSRIKGSGNRVSANVWGRPTGPWVWVTAGTQAHMIAPRRGRGRGKARTTRYLKAPGYAHPYAGAVLHPGATGKGAWTRVRRKARRVAPVAYLAAVRKAVR